MKISLRGNSVLISIPRGEIEQIGVEQEGHIIDEFVMSGRVFDRIVKVSVLVDKVKSMESVEPFVNEDVDMATYEE